MTLTYNCDCYVFNDKEGIGAIDDNGNLFLNPDSSEWRKSIFDEEDNFDCVHCKMLPICFGGCHRRRMNGRKTCVLSESQLKVVVKDYIQLFAD